MVLLYTHIDRFTELIYLIISKSPTETDRKAKLSPFFSHAFLTVTVRGGAMGQTGMHPPVLIGSQPWLAGSYPTQWRLKKLGNFKEFIELVCPLLTLNLNILTDFGHIKVEPPSAI